MGYVRLRPDLNARVAETFGGKVTRPPRFEGSGPCEGVGRHAGEAFERRRPYQH